MAYESWRVYIGFTRDPNDRTAPLTDVTSSVDSERQSIVITRGRTSERSTIANATCSFALQNADQRYTPGNPLSPYAPWVLSGRRVVVTDQVGDDEEIPLFDGYLEFPDADGWQKSSSTAPRDQTVSIHAVDRLARLDNAEAFVSTVGAAVIGEAGEALSHYYTLSETAAPFAATRGTATARTRLGVYVSEGQPLAAPGRFAFGVAGPPPADDIAAAEFTPEVILNTTGVYGYLQVDLNPVLVLSTGQVLTLVAWVNPSPTGSVTTQLAMNLTVGPFLAGTAAIRIDDVGGVLTWGAEITHSGWGSSFSATGSKAPAAPGRPRLVAARLQLAAAQEVWVDDQVTATSFGGSPPASIAYTRLTFAERLFGSISHVQVYLSGATDYSLAAHLAQLTMGMTGLARQRADERITTLAGYAGLAADELDLDQAAALMPAARLARQTPGPLLRSAAAADNGLLFTDGSGRVVFHGRDRRYTPILAATVDLTWLEPPLAWRTDPPTNTMDVSPTSGAAGHAVNADSVTEFTARGGSASLDTACDADPGNLAAFTVREFGRPRQHAVALAFELRTRTTDQRALILRRQISDRCALSGLPDSAPEGTNTFHIEGIRHVVSTAGHRVEWSTGGVLGDVPGVVQPYPRVGQAVVREETRIPF